MSPRLSRVSLLLLAVLTACDEVPARVPPALAPLAGTRAQALAGDGKVQPGEQCDDGNTQDGDGCSRTGALETGFLCHVPGQACSLASLCGNAVPDSGEACDDGNTQDNGNGCTAACDVSRCGDGALDNLSFPSFSQEICDDGNRFDGDGCSRQCEVEPGFACAGSPSRCVPSGVVLFNTGVDANNHRLPNGPDPHWFYAGTSTGAATGSRIAGDWPRELQTARFMGPQGSSTCVYQDFLLPSNLNLSAFRLRLATFNDNGFSTASVNGTAFTPALISEPPGQPWQKNVIREFGPSAPWQAGINRIELCNENNGAPPNAFRYLFVDAYDDRCGDGVRSPREECDDGNTSSDDECSASCAIIDLTPPAAPILEGPVQGATVPAALALGGQAEPGSQITVTEESAVLCTATASASGAWSCTPSQPLAPGPHSVFVTAMDSAANVSPPCAWRAFTVDVAAPAAPALTAPGPGQVLADGAPSIRGIAEPGSTLCVYVDGDMTPVCTAVAAENGAWSCTVSGSLAEGTHSLTASATDPVGNTGPGASLTSFTVDTQPPDTFITSGPPRLALTGDASFEFASSEAEVTYECGADDERFIRCPDTSVFLPGVHTLKVRAVDAAGNVDPSPAEYTWTVRLPHLAGGGCSAAPWRATWLALLALAAVAGRSRCHSGIR